MAVEVSTTQNFEVLHRKKQQPKKPSILGLEQKRMGTD